MGEKGCGGKEDEDEVLNASKKENHCFAVRSLICALVICAVSFSRGLLFRHILAEEL